ncbi:MAG: transposase [Patescibacteria group bacterium]|nr:transposase [Patescibacteria group bacterium]
MPYRKFPPDVGNFYHIFNRSIGRQSIFTCYRDYQRALETLNFYSFAKTPQRFSYFNKLTLPEKIKFLESLKQNSGRQVDTLAFCFMPNHIHFAFKEIRENGIATFMRKFQNSYAKYFNIKYERAGALFQSMFRVERILDEENLGHVIQYIHSNPIKSGIVKTEKDLEHYEWSSLVDYLGKRNLSFLNKISNKPIPTPGVQYLP